MAEGSGAIVSWIGAHARNMKGAFGHRLVCFQPLAMTGWS